MCVCVRVCVCVCVCVCVRVCVHACVHENEGGRKAEKYMSVSFILVMKLAEKYLVQS